MNRPLHYEPVAREEIAERLLHYRSVSEEIGDKFLRNLKRAIERIGENPKQYAKEFKQFRVVRIGKFQDLLFYRLIRDEIWVEAAIHGRRDPRAIRKRLS